MRMLQLRGLSWPRRDDRQSVRFFRHMLVQLFRRREASFHACRSTPDGQLLRLAKRDEWATCAAAANLSLPNVFAELPTIESVVRSARSPACIPEAWLSPNPKNLDAMQAIFDDRARPFYEHRWLMAA